MLKTIGILFLGVIIGTLFVGGAVALFSPRKSAEFKITQVQEAPTVTPIVFVATPTPVSQAPFPTSVIDWDVRCEATTNASLTKGKEELHKKISELYENCRKERVMDANSCQKYADSTMESGVLKLNTTFASFKLYCINHAGNMTGFKDPTI